MIPFSVKNVREPIEYDTYWGVPNEYRGKSWWNEQQTLESYDVYYPWRCKNNWNDSYMLFKVKSSNSMSRVALFQEHVFPYPIFRKF